MTDECIELLKNWEPKNMVFPAIVEEKIDGVPVRIRRIGSHILAWTRQNEPVKSIPHILAVAGRWLEDGGSIVGELHIQGLPFKKISGIVRRTVPDADTAKLIWHVFDFDQRSAPSLSYEARRGIFEASLDRLLRDDGRAPDDIPVRLIPGVVVYDQKGAETVYDMIMASKPDAEGVVVHSLAKAFQPGKRCWGTQRIKPQPTIEVMIETFTEAIDKKTGQGLGRVGSLQGYCHMLLQGKLARVATGIGPGALSHAQAAALWRYFKSGKWTPRIAEVKYMLDETYKGLRQPAFVRFRTDKQEADIA